MKTKTLESPLPRGKTASLWARILLTATAQFVVIYTVVHTIIISLGFYEFSSFVIGTITGTVLGILLGIATGHLFPDRVTYRWRLPVASLCVCLAVLAISVILFETFRYHIELYDTAWYALFYWFPQMLLVPMAFPGTLAFCIVHTVMRFVRKNNSVA